MARVSILIKGTRSAAESLTPGALRHAQPTAWFRDRLLEDFKGYGVWTFAVNGLELVTGFGESYCRLSGYKAATPKFS